MPTPTNLFLNWGSVVVTPAGGSAITVAEILDVEPDAQTKQEIFYGDALKFPRLIVPVERRRSLTIVTGNVAALIAIAEDVPCTIVATLLDAVNGAGAGGGGITLTLAKAMRQSHSVKAPNNKFGGATVKFEAYGNTGDTDPLTIVAL